MASDAVDPRFAPVADALPRVLGKARGGAVAVYHHGELVLDAWTGAKHSDGSEPWAYDTMAMVWSATKGISAAMLHLLAQRGHLGLDEPVAGYWPGFERNGKAATTIRQLLAHEAGLHDIRHLVNDGRALLDHDQIATALAGARPAYEPGLANGYHALTFGFLVDELVRRIEGRTLAEMVQTELTEPLQLDGLSIGLPVAEQEARLAAPTIFQPLSTWARRAGKAANLVTRWPPLRVNLATVAAAFVPRGGEVIGTPEFIAEGNGSVAGVCTARSLARFYSSLVTTTEGHAPLWSADTLTDAIRPINDRRDLVLSIRPHWRAGYHLPWPRRRIGPRAFGFWGMYGSGAWADPDQALAVALVCPDAQGLPLNTLNRLVLDAIEPPDSLDRPEDESAPSG